MKEKGFIYENVHGTGNFRTTRKLNVSIRKKAFEDVFGEIKKTSSGRHNTRFTGKGSDYGNDLKKYEFGDRIENIAISESLKNAYINHGFDGLRLTQKDLEVHYTFYEHRMRNDLMIE